MHVASVPKHIASRMADARLIDVLHGIVLSSAIAGDELAFRSPKAFRCLPLSRALSLSLSPKTLPGSSQNSPRIIPKYPRSIPNLSQNPTNNCSEVLEKNTFTKSLYNRSLSLFRSRSLSLYLSLALALSLSLSFSLSVSLSLTL